MMSAFAQDAKYVIDFLRSRGFMCWTINDNGSSNPAHWEDLLVKYDKVQNVIVSRQSIA